MLENLGGLENVFSILIVILNDWILPFIKAWWWIIPPFLFWGPFTRIWLWWKQELNWKSRKYVILEIKLPTETLKPIKAMENIFNTFVDAAGDREPGNFREKWIEGDTTFFPSISLEIAGIGGSIHFFIRVEDIYRDWIESAIYAQYPNIEIAQVEDYTQKVPQDIPVGNWKMEGRDWVLREPDCYPIKTYEKFETGMESKEEKRVDPVAKLLEMLSMLSPGEQAWIQILLKDPDKDWKEEGEKIRDKLSKRPEDIKEPEKSIIRGAAELLIKGPQEKEEEKEERIAYPEMMMTPGERDVVKELEKKISKPGVSVALRIIYLGTKDVFFKPHIGLAAGFLNSLGTKDLNSFKPIGETSTKVKSALFWFLDDRRAFLRKRRMFKNYVNRFTPLFPNPGGTMFLNIEELATLFHFPSKIVAPTHLVPRVEAKKGEAPSGLPVG
ncbi:MAG: hypothetical protein ISS87_00765 [Candidatus Pacebacteria bacterium]|nr:hypothetical protein [Candidatus Paceibacterota bacterium]